MKLYDRMMADSNFWQSADWYDSLSDMERHDVDSDIRYGRHEDWARMNDGQSMSRFRRHLQCAVIIDASNVAAYTAIHGFNPETMPSWIPPFTATWFETSKVNTPTDRYDHEDVYQQVGALVVTRDYHEPPDTPCFYTFWDVVVLQNGRIKLHPGAHNMDFPCDERGVWTADYWEEYWQTPAIHDITPFLMAIGFTHCKNVELVEGNMAEGALRKKQERKLGRPLTQFKELVIDPSMSQKRYVGVPRVKAGEKPSKSRHIVRGHFATYTEERKLFGRIAGTVWKSPHLRGSDDVGTVYKDYRIKGVNP